MCPGGVGFEISPASRGRGEWLVAKLTRPGLRGVSVRVVGNWLGLQIRKPDAKHGNAKGGSLLLENSA